MSKIVGKVMVDVERCKGCGLCVEACPAHVLTMSDVANSKGYNYVVMSSADCMGCASCGMVCPDGCITIYRKKL